MTIHECRIYPPRLVRAPQPDIGCAHPSNHQHYSVRVAHQVDTLLVANLLDTFPGIPPPLSRCADAMNDSHR